MSAQVGLSLHEARADGEHWGHLVESAVGAHLANAAAAGRCEVFYWSDKNRELDFVVRRGVALAAIEVKSGRRRGGRPGLDAFAGLWHVTRTVFVGEGGIPLAEFLACPVDEWVRGAR